VWRAWRPPPLPPPPLLAAQGALVDASLPGRPSLASVASAPVRCIQEGPADCAPAATLGELWAAAPRPTVLVFLRRLGCPLCRVYAQDVEALRAELGDSARVVCLTFERFGEGSDAPPVKGGGFQAGGFFRGDMFQVMDQARVYGPLFGRKGAADGYGMGDVLSDKSKKMALATARGVEGNLVGDGMQLGGQFVVLNGLVVLDKRQEFFGDDATLEECVRGPAKAGPNCLLAARPHRPLTPTFTPPPPPNISRLRNAVRDAIGAPLLSFRAPA
jgi:hypothetical protein